MGEEKLQEFENEDPLAVDLLEQAIRGLKKDTEHVIAAHEDFWNKISQTEITDIYSFGFSYGGCGSSLYSESDSVSEKRWSKRYLALESV